jgi:hypothetical protein
VGSKEVEIDYIPVRAEENEEVYIADWMVIRVTI